MKTLIGFHGGVGGNHTGIGLAWREARESNTPVVFCSVEDRGKIEECYTGNWGRYAPILDHDVLVMRHEFADNGRWLDVPHYFTEKPEDYVKELLSIKKSGNESFGDWLKRYPKVWCAVGNETNKDDDKSVEWQMQFFLEVGKILNSMGIRALVFNWAGGCPEPRHWLTPNAEKLLTYAVNNKDKFAIGMHLYSLNDNDGMDNYPTHWGRWRDVEKACLEFGLHDLPTIIAKEAGYGKEGMPTDKKGINAILNELDEWNKTDSHIARMMWCLQAFPQAKNAHDKTQKLIMPLKDQAINNQYIPYYFPAEFQGEPVEIPDYIGKHEIWHAIPKYSIENNLVITSESWSVSDSPLVIRQRLTHPETGKHYICEAMEPEWDVKVIYEYFD